MESVKLEDVPEMTSEAQTIVSWSMRSPARPPKPTTTWLAPHLRVCVTEAAKPRSGSVSAGAEVTRYVIELPSPATESDAHSARKLRRKLRFPSTSSIVPVYPTSTSFGAHTSLNELPPVLGDRSAVGVGTGAIVMLVGRPCASATLP